MFKRMMAGVAISLLLSSLVLAAGDQTEEEREGGIVGTCIVGTITELGSIHVNGQHVVYPQTMIVTSPLGDRPAADLSVGETVALEAIPENGGWHARHIGLYVPLIGPVSNAGPQDFTVLGSRVVVGADTVLADGGGDLADGDWVAVFGLWRGPEVMASRLVKIEPRERAMVVGTLQSGAADGSVTVGGTRVVGITPRHAGPKNVLTVHGTPEDGAINAQSVAVGLFSGPVGDILMEGYLSQPNAQGVYTIYGSGVAAYTGDRPMAVPSGRGLYCAQSTERQPIVSLAELPENEAIRRRLLSDIGGEAARRCGG